LGYVPEYDVGLYEYCIRYSRVFPSLVPKLSKVLGEPKPNLMEGTAFSSGICERNFKLAATSSIGLH